MKRAILFYFMTLLGLNLAEVNDSVPSMDLFQCNSPDGNPSMVTLTVPTDSLLWPKGVAPYVINSDLSAKLVDMIFKAMRHIEDRTCIRFVPRTNQRDYILLRKGSGCNSAWGRRGRKQFLNLAGGCSPLGTIVHELLHALGFAHEQYRPDRDEYVYIFWDRLTEGWKSSFKQYTASEARMVTPFDYDSIMLYGSLGFTKDPKAYAMIATKWKQEYLPAVYEKPGMSISDIIRVKIYYDKECGTTPSSAYSFLHTDNIRRHWTSVVLTMFLTIDSI